MNVTQETKNELRRLLSAQAAAAEKRRAALSEGINTDFDLDALINAKIKLADYCIELGLPLLDAIAAAEAERDRLLAALTWAMSRIDRLAPHQASEGDGELYAMASAKATLGDTPCP